MKLCSSAGNRAVLGNQGGTLTGARVKIANVSIVGSVRVTMVFQDTLS